MCGIAGYIGKKSISNKTIYSTGDLMKNRGPNNFSFSHYKKNKINVYLLHSRLSIIDLNSRSNQPYEFKDKVLIFNGEIYNYLEIKKELEKKNISFETSSDTEVLIKALDFYKEEAFKKLEGMWAFALYDKTKNNILLSRDRFGEKPLCFKKTRDGIYFGSELKFIEKLSKYKEQINLTKSKKYLRYGYNSVFLDNETFKKNIYFLSPSTNATIGKNLSLKKKIYWSLNYIKEDKQKSFENHIKDVKKTLINSVKIRLRSDVKNIFCLSGGVDSGGVVSVAAKILKVKPSTYSIIDTNSKKYDETYLINKTLKDTKSKNYKLRVGKINFLKEIDKITKYFSSPVLTINYMLYSLMLKDVSSKGYKVILSGNGADEIFSGYYDHYIYHLLDLKKQKIEFKKNLNFWKKNILSIIRNPKYREIKEPNQKELISVNDNFKSYIKKPINLKFKFPKINKSRLKNVLIFQLKERLMPSLYQEDMNSMMYSVENRAPFLDRNLIEKTLSIPSKYFISNGYSKNILRKSLKGILNNSVRKNRKKYGFNASISSFKDINKYSIINYLKKNKVNLNQIVKFKKINKYIYDLKFDKLSDEDNKFLFRLISLSSFLKTN